ncbi:GNAT family N-acetyltransferase [Bacillus sp. FJAT-27445]|uniref:GNAT family N-acetyltransferase n=1 Tax=Bacillus sp. FJAT-27445 TaxID=1679166 RepID=UPI00074418C1|nr:GNAT family N-acetyltransferase [Bacillus sp. FJAT-27445]
MISRFLDIYVKVIIELIQHKVQFQQGILEKGEIVMEIIDYQKEYEEGWLRCRVLAYLHTSMYEDVVTQKPTFGDRPSIELLAIENNEVIGILDMVLDSTQQKTTILGNDLGAFLQVIAVHPDYQSKKIGQRLFNTALERLSKTNISFIELYTRDDVQANNFYQKLGFEKRLEYYDVFGVENGLRRPVSSMEYINGRVKAKYENGDDCDYVLIDGVYEVYNLESLKNFDYDRCYPARGYYKKIKTKIKHSYSTLGC